MTTISSKWKTKPWKNYTKNSTNNHLKSLISSPLPPTKSPSANTLNSSSPQTLIFITKLMDIWRMGNNIIKCFKPSKEMNFTHKSPLSDSKSSRN